MFVGCPFRKAIRKDCDQVKNESVDTAIVCMINHDELEENLRAMAGPYTGYGPFALARERFLEMPQAARDVRYTDCTSFSFRCAYGVAVRDRLTHAQEMLA